MNKEKKEQVIRLLTELATDLQPSDKGEFIFSVIASKEGDEIKLHGIVGGAPHHICKGLVNLSRQQRQIGSMITAVSDKLQKKGLFGEPESIGDLIKDFLEDLEKDLKGRKKSRPESLDEFMSRMMPTGKVKTEADDTCNCPACQIRRILEKKASKSNPNVN